jgi:hypothetical protein
MKNDFLKNVYNYLVTKIILHLQRTSRCHVASWFCDYINQYDDLFNFWVYIYILIYLNHLKIFIQKYHLFND